MKSIAEFSSEIRSTGFSVFANLVDAGLLHELKVQIPKVVELRRSQQIRNGLNSGFGGSAHHVLGDGPAFTEFLARRDLDPFLSAYFGGAPYILNSFGAIMNLPEGQGSGDYAHGSGFHRDVRTFTRDFNLLCIVLLMVDDFTFENGSTRVVPGSNLVFERPSEDELLKRSVRVNGSAGTALIMDGNLWHAASPNRTDHPRMAISLTFSRAFMKQQLDYPRMLGKDFPRDERMRQLLGYYAQVPQSLDEWFQPQGKRFYHRDQG